MRTFSLSIGLLLSLLLSLLVQGAAICLAQAPPDAIDVERANRYINQLKTIEQRRVALRDRASSLAAKNPAFLRDMEMAVQNEMVSRGILSKTPQFYGIPHLLVYRGQSGHHPGRPPGQFPVPPGGGSNQNPQLLVWYTLQDNTYLRQALMQSIYNSRQSAVNNYAALQNNLVMMEEIARDADELFWRYRREADFMGRRSSTELTAAGQLTERWVKDDPLHAGATLIMAYSLRTGGQSDEAKNLLSMLDNNFPIMESITDAVSAQIAYLSDDVKAARRLLDQAVNDARQSGTTEAYLVYGWIALAGQDYEQAQNFAGKARQLLSNPKSKADTEVSILEALAGAYEKPTRARDSLQLLRHAQLSTTPDDWHYHEAMALIHIMAKDKQFAKREIDAALQSAPSFIRAELEAERATIDAGDLPQIDWKNRLKLLWQHQ